jgi:hypothetical protein
MKSFIPQALTLLFATGSTGEFLAARVSRAVHEYGANTLTMSNVHCVLL